jgi:hypothetical protein
MERPRLWGGKDIHCGPCAPQPRYHVVIEVFISEKSWRAITLHACHPSIFRFFLKRHLAAIIRRALASSIANIPHTDYGCVLWLRQIWLVLIVLRSVLGQPCAHLGEKFRMPRLNIRLMSGEEFVRLPKMGVQVGLMLQVIGDSTIVGNQRQCGEQLLDTLGCYASLPVRDDAVECNLAIGDEKFAFSLLNV